MYEGLRRAAELARTFQVSPESTGRPRRVLKEFARSLDELAESHTPADDLDRNYTPLTLTGNLERDLHILADWIKTLTVDQLFIAIGLSVYMRAGARAQVATLEAGE